MDNPSFEEYTDERKKNWEELDANGPEMEDKNSTKMNKELNGPENKVDSLNIPFSQSVKAPELQATNEEPYDEPDGGEKKESPDKKATHKRGISFFQESHDTGSKDSDEGKVFQREDSEEKIEKRRELKSIVWKDSTDVYPTLEKKKNYRQSMASLYSVASTISLDPKDAAYKTLAGFVVLKILFWDIGSSLGDTVTDFLQGFNLVFDLMAQEWFKLRHDTLGYGILVLLINWVPGFVAVIHMVTSYRREYFSLPNTGQRDLKTQERIEKRKRYFLIAIFCCFFFYPIVPTVGYLIVLWNINNNDSSNSIHRSRVELFARTSHSISGCVESPLQLMMTFYLIFIGLLDNPLKASIYTREVNDRFGNTILPSASIPFWTMSFSILNIIGSAIQVNIFNVYIGQIRNMYGFKKYINLTCGHFPFFFHSIIFRVLAVSFFIVYLDLLAFIPIFLILFSNIIIGYLTSAEHKLPSWVRKELRKRRKEMRKREDHPTLDAQGGGGSRPNTSIWLNSFLGICVPTCFVQDVDPVLLLDMEEKAQQEIFKSQKNYQKKVIRYQIQTSVTIILLTLLATFCCVNFGTMKYHPNRFENMEFNILCGVLLAMGLTAFLFVREIDVYEVFKMNEEPALIEEIIVTVKTPAVKLDEDEEPEDQTDNKIVTISVPDEAEVEEVSRKARNQKKYGTMRKLVTTILITLLTLVPLIVGYLVASTMSHPSTFILAKSEDSSGLTITAVRSKLLNTPESQGKFQGEGIFCRESYTRFDCANSRDKDKILVVDLGINDCLKEMERSIKNDQFTCLPYKGIVLLENWKDRSSSPYPLEVPSDATKFPVVSINSKDTTNKQTDIFNKTHDLTRKHRIEISMKEYQEILEDEDSELYETECENTCLHMFTAKDKYLGCKGVPKLNVPLSLKCFDKGKSCAELITFRKRLKNPTQNPFSNCFDQEGIILDRGRIEYPRPRCNIPSKMWLDGGKCTDSDEENSFDWSTSHLNDNDCLDNDGNIISYSNEVKKNYCDCHWGEWSAEDDRCSTPGIFKARERYQLCKNKKCVIIRRDLYILNQNTGACDMRLSDIKPCREHNITIPP